MFWRQHRDKKNWNVYGCSEGCVFVCLHVFEYVWLMNMWQQCPTFITFDRSEAVVIKGKQHITAVHLIFYNTVLLRRKVCNAVEKESENKWRGRWKAKTRWAEHAGGKHRGGKMGLLWSGEASVKAMGVVLKKLKRKRWERITRVAEGWMGLTGLLWMIFQCATWNGRLEKCESCPPIRSSSFRF